MRSDRETTNSMSACKRAHAGLFYAAFALLVACHSESGAAFVASSEDSVHLEAAMSSSEVSGTIVAMDQVGYRNVVILAELDSTLDISQSTYAVVWCEGGCDDAHAEPRVSASMRMGHRITVRGTDESGLWMGEVLSIAPGPARFLTKRAEVDDESGWTRDSYRDTRFECARKEAPGYDTGFHTYTVFHPPGADASSRLPLYIFLHGGGVAYFDEDGSFPVEDNFNWTDEESYEEQLGFLNMDYSDEVNAPFSWPPPEGTVQRRVVDSAAYRILVPANCDNDLFSGIETYTTDPNNVGMSHNNTTNKVDGLLSLRTTIDDVVEIYPTSSLFTHGCSAGGVGVFSLLISEIFEGLAKPTHGMISDSGTHKAGPEFERWFGSDWFNFDPGWPKESCFAYDMDRVKQRVGPYLSNFLTPDRLIAGGHLNTPMVAAFGTADRLYCGNLSAFEQAALGLDDVGGSALYSDVTAAIDLYNPGGNSQVHAYDADIHCPTVNPAGGAAYNDPIFDWLDAIRSQHLVPEPAFASLFHEGSLGSSGLFTGKGELVGDASLRPDSGRFGGGLSLANEGDHMALPGSSHLNAGNQLTIMAWVYRTDRDEDAVIFGDHLPANSETSSVSVELSVGEDVLRFRSNNCLGDVVAMSSPLHLPLYNWEHVAVTWDGIELRYYQDGKLNSVIPFAVEPCSVENDYAIGARSDGTGSFGGNLDEIKAWGVALSPEQILLEM